MLANNTMKALLKQHHIQSIHCIPLDDAYPIWKKADAVGRSYWGVSHFWGMDQHPIHLGQHLSQMEWDGNEICLEAETPEEITGILKKALGIMRFWKEELEAKYADTPFYILASYDNGDLMILDEGEAPTQSVTLRFWADRGDKTVIDFEDFENWDQPVIVEYCNFIRT